MTLLAYAASAFGRRSAALSNAFPSHRAAGFSVTAARAFGANDPVAFNPRGGGSVSTSTAIRSATCDSTEAVNAKLAASLSVTHPAYEVLSTDVVEEYGAYCTLYRHVKSGAELLSVAADDDNKVFGVTFRTPPSDDTGVPHILEHSVLCGSRRFTTKDPFVQLLQGSLQTFLNAFTYPDRTCYVVASQNTKDFYNLVNVYADAVFHPRAVSDPNVHAQEGWHLELEKKDDPLTYKGVVYNEMKGVYSSPDSLLYRRAQNSLFPDNTYAVDSGGDPKAIPDLSFEDFKEFHERFYHPANSRIYFSGDDDVAERLRLMDEYLCEFDASPESRPASVVKTQNKRFAEPLKETHPYPVSAESDDADSHMVMINWLLDDKRPTATQELAVGVLDHLLMGTTQSILRKTLMESGLGAAVVGGGVSDELLQATFSVGLKGVKPEKVEDVEKLIDETLKKAVEEGFADDAIAASMNTIEFQMREFNTGSFPRGLSFMLGSMTKWLYDESPTDALKFEEPLRELKAQIAESGSAVFSDMIRDLFINNTHRTTVQMVPSTTLESEQLKEEEDRLAAIKAELDDDKLENIIKSTKELKALQAAEDSPEDRATVPSLTLNDLERKVTEYPIAVTENENDTGVTMVRHEMSSTSGIAYVDVGLDMSGVPLEDVPLLSMFSRLLKENGAGDLSDVALSRRIGTYTGGVSVSLNILGLRKKGEPMNTVGDGSHLSTKLFFRGKATSDRTEYLFEIFNLMMKEANLDCQSKVLEMIRESKARLSSSIQGSGHQYSNSRLKSRYSPVSYISEIMGGITYVDTLKKLEEQAENDWPALLARFENIRNVMLEQSTCRDGVIVNLTGDKAVLDTVQPDVDKFISSLPGDGSNKLPDFYTTEHPWITAARAEMSQAAPVKDEGFVVATQVSYVGKGGRLFEKGETVPGSTAVVSKFLRTGYLWDHVRVIGGAYGGFCTFSPEDGFFSFLSYRDPNLAGTLDVYDATASHLAASAKALAEDPDALSTAIIGAIGDMDSVLSVDQKGWTSLQRWMSGVTPEARQRFRNEIIDCSAEDFAAFSERLEGLKDPSVAVVSSKGAFEAAAKAGKEMELMEVA